MPSIMNENQAPAGSEPINPMVSDNQEPAPAATVETETTVPAGPDKQEPVKDDSISKFEKMIAASQSMIGKQSSEIGALRAKLEEMSKPPAGPNEDEQLKAIYQRMDSGDIDIAEGMQQALAINSNLTASRVMSQLSQQQKQENIAKLQTKFLSDNPDYEQTLQSGVLKPYLDADPLSDEYTAYKMYKADEKLKGAEAEAQQKILAAKEEGAKLAKGSEAAGKVLGKQGSTAMAPQVARPFKSTQEAQDAMMATLQQMRSSAAT